MSVSINAVVVEKLKRLANHLDSRGLFAEANYIDGIIKVAARKKAKYSQAFRVWIMRVFDGESKSHWYGEADNSSDVWQPINKDLFILQLKHLRDRFFSSSYSDGFSSASGGGKMKKSNGYLRSVSPETLDYILEKWMNPAPVSAPQQGDGVVDIIPGELHDLADQMEGEGEQKLHGEPTYRPGSEQLGLFENS
jgi:hypothetical protein